MDYIVEERRYLEGQIRKCPILIYDNLFDKDDVLVHCRYRLSISGFSWGYLAHPTGKWNEELRTISKHLPGEKETELNYRVDDGPGGRTLRFFNARSAGASRLAEVDGTLLNDYLKGSLWWGPSDI